VIGPCDPCKTANAAEAIWSGGNARVQFRACTTPSPRGRIRASPLGPLPEQETKQGMLPRHATQGLQQKPVPNQHKETPGNTQATATAQYTQSTLLKSSNRPMTVARRRQGQQLYAWHGTPSRRPQAAPPFPLTPADKDKDRGACTGPPHSYHKSQVHICVITGLECQKIQHKCASCVKTGLECQNLTRFSRAWVGGAIALRGWPWRGT